MKKNIFSILTIIFILSYHLNIFSAIVKIDNDEPEGNMYKSNWAFFEESIVLQPDGPCSIESIDIYFSGVNQTTDTLWIVGFPTSGNLWPTQYIWHFNSLIEPIIFEYDGKPGWKNFDIRKFGLRSEGLDRIVIQHIMKPQGPWFTYDSDNRNKSYDSWITDPYTPNSSFYNIVGTIFYYPLGDYMIRFNVQYDFPLGEGSDKPPAPQFIDVSAQVGLSGRGMSSVVDWNNDGWDDIENAGSFFESNGDGTFKNINSQLSINRGNTTWGDINNDGLLDMFVALSWGTDKVYLNEGNNKYSDLTAKTTILNNYPTMTPIWFDYNNDGLLDLFIANNRSSDAQGNETYYPDQLWKNNGDSSFSNVRNESGIINGEPGQNFDCYGASANDYNNDNFTDIFVANYRLARDNQYKNLGNSTFSDVGATTGLQGVPTPGPDYFGHGMGCQWGDFNNDGNIDLCVGNLAHTDSRGQVSNPSLIFKNNGPPDYNFEEVHLDMGLKFFEGNAGVLWLDFDNDGYLDLWHGLYSGGVNHLYRNQGPPDFKLKEITWVSGTVVTDPWTASSIDYDNDGDLDILIYGSLYRNDFPNQGNRLQLKLIGSPENQVNMDCYGTRVNVYAGGKLFHRQLSGSAGGSRCVQNSNVLHFGLGNVSDIDSIIINYPNGEVHKLNNIKPNARYKIPYLGEPESFGLLIPSLLEPNQFSFGVQSELQLTWLESFGATDYLIEVYKDKNMQDLYLNQIVNSKTNFDYNFDNNTTYFWRVKAIDGIDSSNYSTLWQFTVGIEQPSKISIISPIQNQIDLPNQPTIQWTEPTYHCDYCDKNTYEIEISTSQEPENIVYSRTGLKESQLQLDSELTSDTQYKVRVRAKNDNVSGEWADYITFTTMQAPSKPILTSPENASKEINEKPKFEWQKVTNADSYDLQVSINNDFSELFMEVEKLKSNTFRNLGTKFTSGTEFFWRIRANNAGGHGDWSDSWSFTTEGTKPVILDNINLYNVELNPVPAENYLNVNIQLNKEEMLIVQIVDIHGIIVFSERFNAIPNYMNNVFHNISSLTSGIYFYQIIGSTYTKTLKFSVIE